MRITETKIYIRFILWFFLVSIVPLAVLFFTISLFFPKLNILEIYGLAQSVIAGLLISLAFVFGLSLLATRLLSRSITKPISISVDRLSKVTPSLLKSVQTLSGITKKDREISQFLLSNSKAQEQGLKVGTNSVGDMVKSFHSIVDETRVSVADLKDIDKLAIQGTEKSEVALKSLVIIKQLATTNQTLNQALDTYADRVKDIAKRVEVLSETTKFLSLNVSIETNKSSFSEDFSNLVSQIRELNITTEQAAAGIQSLATNMQEQIGQIGQSSLHQKEESSKTISILSQTIKFLNKIIANVGNISENVQSISQENERTQLKADSIKQMIGGLNKQSRDLVKRADNIAVIINEQMVVSRSLERSSKDLDQVVNTLDDLVGRH
ncbi:MAG: hypothetical protein C3F02_00235 [Parcubacteria group bacterium]|nr:MAG: hypothetical protein C3F02_00235 [Parcubacteria group bacterium]